MYLPHILLASEEYLYVQIKVGLLACTSNHVMSHKNFPIRYSDSGISFMIPVLTVAETASVFHRIPNYAC